MKACACVLLAREGLRTFRLSRSLYISCFLILGSWGNDGSKGKLFHRFDWRYISSRPFRGKILEAGNYEWHFDHVIAGDMPESVEGRSDSYLIYRLRATIDRGFLSHNIIDRKHVRIIRTLNPAADPLCHETVCLPAYGSTRDLTTDEVQALTGNWEGKINYKIWIPTIGVVFGTTLIVWFRIAPLVKGLRLSKIHLSILETEWVHIRGRRLRARCHRPVKDMYTFPEDQETEVFSGLDCWVFPMQLNLPTALRECRQSVTVEGFHIQHAAEFTVRFVNPDGHMSEVLALPYQQSDVMTLISNRSYAAAFHSFFTYRGSCTSTRTMK